MQRQNNDENIAQLNIFACTARRGTQCAVAVVNETCVL
jgi:hypothetical protein